MINQVGPIVDQWYAHHDKGEMFRVVATDAASGSVDIQYFDGDVEELDGDAWRELDIETAEPPEDWTGPFDDIELDDLGLSETAMRPQDWRICLESNRPAEELWADIRTEDMRDDEQVWHPDLVVH